jgi:hypothetical protein
MAGILGSYYDRIFSVIEFRVIEKVRCRAFSAMFIFVNLETLEKPLAYLLTPPGRKDSALF